jgi:hypothetical protein
MLESRESRWFCFKVQRGGEKVSMREQISCMREQRIVTTEVLMHIPIGAGNAHAYGVPFGLSVTFGLDQMFDILSTGFSTTFVLFIYFIL